ncbi:hypothetical protein MXL46_11300 [Heyndrickxia sporothermodurans]|uniref:Uncharacterized protein n=1 Tax=Siminovitchia thermophila TaxID=1245522 RepID=A0ABS2R6V4_9BACI|nr:MULTISPECIES: hypothetical protein [Bacillaceae]MBM7715367.1 hypothetical protein [Siminovitchia thermophila]MEB6549672.1 hypothetical protein [Heyndrickxia sporothermodurans]
MTRIINCDRCRLLGFSGLQMICKKGKRNFEAIPDENLDEELAKQIDCDEFISKYIEYPLEISGIKQPDNIGIRTDSFSAECGQLVKVRPVNEKYGNKTYLGIYLGDADIGLQISHNRTTKELAIHRHYNPAIFVPELKEIIYGAGSWWGKINSEEELKEISDNDIDNVWYVKLLKGE